MIPFYRTTISWCSDGAEPRDEELVAGAGFEPATLGL